MHPRAANQDWQAGARLGEWTHRPPTHQFPTKDEQYYFQQSAGDEMALTFGFGQVLSSWLLYHNCLGLLCGCVFQHHQWVNMNGELHRHWFVQIGTYLCQTQPHVLFSLWSLKFTALHIHWCLSKHTIQFFKDKNWVKIIQKLSEKVNVIGGTGGQVQG